jgi:histidine triad (HIT) family protein
MASLAPSGREHGLVTYDPNNPFARILRGELPCRKAYEDEWALAFHDINPLAPVHVLVIPKGAYISMADFTAKASDAEVVGFFRAVGKAAAAAGVVESGYRVLANSGRDANQEVPHLHMHIFAGAPLGRMLEKIRE